MQVKQKPSDVMQILEAGCRAWCKAYRVDTDEKNEAGHAMWEMQLLHVHKTWAEHQAVLAMQAKADEIGAEIQRGFDDAALGRAEVANG